MKSGPPLNGVATMNWEERRCSKEAGEPPDGFDHGFAKYAQGANNLFAPCRTSWLEMYREGKAEIHVHLRVRWVESEAAYYCAVFKRASRGALGRDDLGAVSEQGIRRPLIVPPTR